MASGAANDPLRANRPPNCKRRSINQIIRTVAENAGNPEANLRKSKVVRGSLLGDMVGSVSTLAEIMIAPGRNATGNLPYLAFRNNEGFTYPIIRALDSPSIATNDTSPYKFTA